MNSGNGDFKSSYLGNGAITPFDPHTFLAYISAGRTLAAYRQHSPIFAQGEAADAVFYTQDGHGPH